MTLMMRPRPTDPFVVRRLGPQLTPFRTVADGGSLGEKFSTSPPVAFLLTVSDPDIAIVSYSPLSLSLLVHLQWCSVFNLPKRSVPLHMGAVERSVLSL